MQVTVSLECRFFRTPDGRVWARNMFPYSFWKRYLSVFDGVRVVARVQDVNEAESEWREAGGPEVNFIPLPPYHGPMQYVRNLLGIRRALKMSFTPTSAYILRVCSPIGTALSRVLRANNHPFGVEVVGDPWDVFAPGTIEHPLRPLLRWSGYMQLRRLCSSACAASYVTRKTLQQRYPPGSDAFTTHYSSVELPDEAFTTQPKTPTSTARRRVVSVGTLASYYKGPDVLVDAIAECAQRGVDIELRWIGYGECQASLEERAVARGVEDRVQFLGRLPAGDAVRQELDAADIFVLPSRTEGLPRAMIEAMARGLPCIGTHVGGIPELLPRDAMVSPGLKDELVQKLCEVLSDSERMTSMAQNNLNSAKDYREDILQERRAMFYSVVRERTQRKVSR